MFSSARSGRVVNIGATDPAYWGYFGDAGISSGIKTEIEKTHSGVVKTIKEARIDENGRYWIWVGPNVLNPSFSPGNTPHPIDFNWNVKIDLVVKNSEGKELYIPCVPGGIKGYTWDNGVYQTGYPYPNGEPYAGDEFSSPSAVEFMAPQSLQNEAGYNVFKADRYIIYNN